MTCIRQARLGHARFKQKLRRSRRRLRGFQSPGLRAIGNLLVANRDNKRAELNELAIVYAMGCAVGVAYLGGILFGTMGFLIGGIATFAIVLTKLQEHRFYRA